MGNLSSSQRDDEANTGECGLNDPNFRFLMGKVKNVAPAAQRLFSLGKLYLSPEDPDQLNKDRADFEHLFHADEHHLDKDSDQERSKAFRLFRPLKMSKPLQQGQTFMQWKVSHDYQSAYILCLQRRNIIYIQPIDAFPDFVKDFKFRRSHIQVGLFELVQGFAQIFFSGLDVFVLPGIETEALEWNISSRYHQVTGQKQYLVDDFHPRLQELLPSNGICILGFVWTDVFPENYNFVLGEASAKHKTGIFSFGRFPPSTFDPDKPQDITEITGDVIWKLIKVVSHEVCHLFGLMHCEYFHCAMNESSTVGEAMSQPLFLCPVCLRKLHHSCAFDVVERYQEMYRFLRDIQSQYPCQSIQTSILWLQECLTFLEIK